MRKVTWLALLPALAVVACQAVSGVDALKVDLPETGTTGAAGSGGAPAMCGQPPPPPDVCMAPVGPYSLCFGPLACNGGCLGQSTTTGAQCNACVNSCMAKTYVDDAACDKPPCRTAALCLQTAVPAHTSLACALANCAKCDDGDAPPVMGKPPACGVPGTYGATSLALNGCLATDCSTVCDLTMDNDDTCGTDRTAFDLTLVGEDFNPHPGQALFVAIVDQANMNVVFHTNSCISNGENAVAGAVSTDNSFSLHFPGVLNAGSTYSVDYAADLNKNGQCDDPNADHVWHRTIGPIKDDVLLAEIHDGVWSKGLCPEFTAPPQ